MKDYTLSIKELLTNEQTFAVPKQLQLLAKNTITLLKTGIHSAKKMHNNFEFSQYKSYTPGDDLRLVDWKNYGKTQKLFIRQAPKINNIAVHLIPDVSHSMLYKENGISKINFCIYLFACLSSLVLKQQDELHFFNYKKNLQLKEVLQFLTQTSLVNKWTNNKTEYYKSINNNKKKLIIYCSDLYEYDNEMMKWLKLAATRKNEVIVFHLIGEQEKEFHFEKATHLNDLETGQIAIFNKSVSNKAKIYFQNRKDYFKDESYKNGIIYHELLLNELPLNALSKFLTVRSKSANVF